MGVPTAKAELARKDRFAASITGARVSDLPSATLAVPTSQCRLLVLKPRLNWTKASLFSKQWKKEKRDQESSLLLAWKLRESPGAGPKGPRADALDARLSRCRTFQLLLLMLSVPGLYTFRDPLKCRALELLVGFLSRIR